MSTCCWALHSLHWATEGENSLTLPVTKPLKLQKSTALTCLVIGCEIVPTLLLQYAPYYCSTRHIMAKICLFTTVPTLLQQHQLQYCECHRFNCRQHPYYLNIILISTNQALLLHRSRMLKVYSSPTLTTPHASNSVIIRSYRFKIKACSCHVFCNIQALWALMFSSQLDADAFVLEMAAWAERAAWVQK